MSALKKVMLSAVQPSNRLTLGNYLGALKNWADLHHDYDCLFFTVDQHAITARQDPKDLREQTYRAVATYIASGLDPEKNLLFVQSHVPEHTELSWMLLCNTYMGELSRMTQFKDKSSKQGTNIPAGLFAYPSLMAADILLYQTEVVPVGEDQKQHIELTRDLAHRMNQAFGVMFKIPEVMIPKIGARVMSLQDPTSKMSKSDPDPQSAVYLSDSDAEILKKLKRAVTDSGTEIAFDPTQKPGVSNLLTIFAACRGMTLDQAVAHFSGKQYGHLKIETAEAITQVIGPIRERTQALLNDRGELDRILARNALKARERAAATLRRAKDLMGFIPAPH